MFSDMPMRELLGFDPVSLVAVVVTGATALAATGAAIWTKKVDGAAAEETRRRDAEARCQKEATEALAGVNIALSEANPEQIRMLVGDSQEQIDQQLAAVAAAWKAVARFPLAHTAAAHPDPAVRRLATALLNSMTVMLVRDHSFAASIRDIRVLPDGTDAGSRRIFEDPIVKFTEALATIQYDEAQDLARALGAALQREGMSEAEAESIIDRAIEETAARGRPGPRMTAAEAEPILEYIRHVEQGDE
jgi:hypothetical protein